MSVVQVVQKLSPGGLEVLATSLAYKMNMPNFLFSLEGNKADLLNKWGILHHFKNNMTAFQKKEGFQITLIKALSQEFYKLKPKVIITHHIGPLIYAGLAAKLCGIEKILHVEHDGWHLKSKKRAFVEKLILKIVKPIHIAVSEEIALRLKDAGITNVVVIANGIDTEKFKPFNKLEMRERLNLPTKEFLFGAVGRLEKVKGHDLLLKAFAQVTNPNKHLVIAGDGSEKEYLVKLARTLNISDRVHFLGHQDDTAAVYSALDAYILPSRNEGLPLGLLEAQSVGLRAICFDVGAVNKGICVKTGILVEPENTQKLARVMTAFKGNNHISPRDFILKNYDLAKTTAAYQALMCENKG